MIDSKPLVSIGMPVYNGEKYIRRALDSLLAQDYENFELLISDNASTDRTREICLEYAAKDKRIRYYCNDRNVGSVKNFNRLFDLSSGKYFMWAADHDLWHPTFISRCVSILEEDPNVVLAYSRTMVIGPGGEELLLAPDRIDTRGMSAVRRYKLVIWNLYWCNMVYGVMRRQALNQTDRFRRDFGSDHVLLAELALRGTFAQVDAPLFYRREYRPEEEVLEVRKEKVLFALDPLSAAERSKASFKDLYREMRNAHLQMLRSAPIGFLGKMDAAIATLVCFDYRFGVRLIGRLSVKKKAKRLLSKRLERNMLSWLDGSRMNS